MRKKVIELKEGDIFRFEYGDFDNYITARVDKVIVEGAWHDICGTILESRTIGMEKGKYLKFDLETWETVEVINDK